MQPSPAPERRGGPSLCGAGAAVRPAASRRRVERRRALRRLPTLSLFTNDMNSITPSARGAPVVAMGRRRVAAGASALFPTPHAMADAGPAPGRGQHAPSHLSAAAPAFGAALQARARAHPVWALLQRRACPGLTHLARAAPARRRGAQQGGIRGDSSRGTRSRGRGRRRGRAGRSRNPSQSRSGLARDPPDGSALAPLRQFSMVLPKCVARAVARKARCGPHGAPLGRRRAVFASCCAETATTRPCGGMRAHVCPGTACLRRSTRCRRARRCPIARSAWTTSAPRWSRRAATCSGAPRGRPGHPCGRW